MQVISSNKTEINTTQAEFKADAQEFEAQLQLSYLKKRNSIQIPGFRKGKAPRKMIEAQYGESMFYEDAVNGMYQKLISEVIEELELDVVDVQDVEVVSIKKEEGVTFKAKFITVPEVNISGYLGLNVKTPSNTVTDDDIAEKIKSLQMKGARITNVSDRDTKLGDTVIFDFEGFCGDQPFEGGSAKNFSLELGSGKFIPGFEEQLTDKPIGEDFDINVTFPEDYNAKELAGKEAVFKCRINEIKETQLPQLDDEFVKDVSEFDTLSELKADLKEKVKAEKETDKKNIIDNELAQQLVLKLEGEIPEVMFERKIDDLVNEWEYNNSRRGVKLEDYLKYSNMTMEQFRDIFRESAVNRVKLQLALKRIAELENLDITDNELDEEFVKLAEIHKMPLEQVRRAISPALFKKDILNDKALDIVRENAKITTSRAKKKTGTEDK